MTDAGSLLDELVDLLNARDRIDAKLQVVRSKIREQSWYRDQPKGVIAQEPTVHTGLPVTGADQEEVPEP